MKEKISITIDSEVLKGIDQIVDNVTIRNRSQAIEFLTRQSVEGQRTAVILAGGDEERLKLGNTYRPLGLAKGVSVVSRAVSKLREEGFRKIHIIARSKVLTAIFEVLRDGKDYGVELRYVEEKDSQGTMDSLRYLAINERFLVVYSDLLFQNIDLEGIWQEQIRNKGSATIMLTTSSEPSEKGTVKLQGSKVVEFTQKKASDNYLVFSPIFVGEPELLGEEGHSLEYDVFPRLASKGLLNGYVSSEKEKHVHSEDDLRNI